MDWLQISITTDQPDSVEECLFASGAVAVTLADAAAPDEEHPILEPGPGETPLWDHITVTGLFSSRRNPDDILLSLQQGLALDTSPDCKISLLEDRDWVRAWMDRFEPLQFGERLWVCPHHHEIDQPDAVVLRLDPGLAFGTGTHPTTSLCLQWLAQADLAGKTLIDYGCGSGILAIAAALLGAGRILAIDIDPQALAATTDNARRNGVSDRIVTATAAQLLDILPDALHAPQADIVVANILAGPLRELAPEILSLIKPGGQLLLAGLLDAQVEEVRLAYGPHIDWLPPASLEGWARLTGLQVQA